MKTGKRQLGLRVRVVLGHDVAIGPGKADLLEGIRATGSIAAAGREMGMSYKRAWYLVDSMNDCFRSPLVEKVKGGAAGGGARLTPLGETVLECYRRIEDVTDDAAAPELRKLAANLRGRSSNA